MNLAAEELNPPPDEDPLVTVMVPIPMKPRVHAWFQREFAGHLTLTPEERLGRYLMAFVGRARLEAIRAAEGAPEINSTEAVTMTRAQFAQTAPAS